MQKWFKVVLLLQVWAWKKSSHSFSLWAKENFWIRLSIIEHIKNKISKFHFSYRPFTSCIIRVKILHWQCDKLLRGFVWVRRKTQSRKLINAKNATQERVSHANAYKRTLYTNAIMDENTNVKAKVVRQVEKLKADSGAERYVEPITNLGHTGGRSPRPCLTYWSLCRHRCRRPQAAHSEWSGFHWNPWHG